MKSSNHPSFKKHIILLFFKKKKSILMTRIQGKNLIISETVSERANPLFFPWYVLSIGVNNKFVFFSFNKS